MKIITDSTWGYIYDENNSTCLLHYKNPYEYQSLINRIFSKSQQIRHLDHDGLYTLSKKGEKILLEEIEKQKT